MKTKRLKNIADSSSAIKTTIQYAYSAYLCFEGWNFNTTYIISRPSSFTPVFRSRFLPNFSNILRII